ncbi:hypothetical protein FA95DRAFT_1602227 [Auriscalpium vulgare]|uniref:Uncharacterized protein n=1 Tax=Auriscalpium vulgare TaxID=40419 RepID=A0ACB8S722_9AGAM|nr:hypothetical protein FA95DRAFT_1602227 [Auriscalpium vulgare]
MATYSTYFPLYAPAHYQLYTPAYDPPTRVPQRIDDYTLPECYRSGNVLVLTLDTASSGGIEDMAQSEALYDGASASDSSDRSDSDAETQVDSLFDDSPPHISKQSFPVDAPSSSSASSLDDTVCLIIQSYLPDETRARPVFLVSPVHDPSSFFHLEVYDPALLEQTHPDSEGMELFKSGRRRIEMYNKIAPVARDARGTDITGGQHTHAVRIRMPTAVGHLNNFTHREHSQSVPALLFPADDASTLSSRQLADVHPSEMPPESWTELENLVASSAAYYASHGVAHNADLQTTRLLRDGYGWTVILDIGGGRLLENTEHRFDEVIKCVRSVAWVFRRYWGPWYDWADYSW